MRSGAWDCVKCKLREYKKEFEWLLTHEQCSFLYRCVSIISRCTLPHYVNSAHVDKEAVVLMWLHDYLYKYITN